MENCIMENFDGNPARCRGFLLQNQLYLASKSNVSDQSKIVHMIDLLMGKAFTWATAICDKGGEPVCSYECFLSLFHRVFDHAPEGKEVGDLLTSFKQGLCWVVEYTLEFCTLAAELRLIEQERICFLITDTPKHSVILGTPWLQLHNPCICWVQRETLSWSDHCCQHCLTPLVVLLATTCMESPIMQQSVHIPEEYTDFLNIFNKAKPCGLPLLQTYDCR